MAKRVDNLFAKELSSQELEDGQKLYDRWQLECYDAESFSSWLAAYRALPEKNQNGKILRPTKLLYCSEADRSQCAIERFEGRCILSDRHFKQADDIALAAELKDSWDFMEVIEK